MPNRIVRETILTSDRVETLDAGAEVFYRRLLSKVDDYGRFDARPAILRASLYPLRLDRVREADCTRWMAACQMAGLLVLYTHADKPYLEVANTGWQARSPSKFPDPSEAAANICAQVQTSARLVVDVDVDVSAVVGEAPRGAVTFARWTASLNGESAIPADHPVFEYAAKVGIPPDYLALAWAWFERTYGAGGSREAKRQKSWPQTFQNAVEGNWAKAWFVADDGAYRLTTAGQQLQRAAA